MMSFSVTSIIDITMQIHTAISSIGATTFSLICKTIFTKRSSCNPKRYPWNPCTVETKKLEMASNGLETQMGRMCCATFTSETQKWWKSVKERERFLDFIITVDGLITWDCECSYLHLSSTSNLFCFSLFWRGLSFFSFFIRWFLLVLSECFLYVGTIH